MIGKHSKPGPQWGGSQPCIMVVCGLWWMILERRTITGKWRRG